MPGDFYLWTIEAIKKLIHFHFSRTFKHTMV